VPWDDGANYRDVVVKANSSWAATFLPNNGFGANPPRDFQGHGTIECFSGGPFGNIDRTADVLAFVLVAQKWAYGVGVPVKKDVAEAHSRFEPQQNWQGAYVIPRFDDTNGATARQWVTGVSIQNFDAQPVSLTVKYTVGQTYAEHDQKWSVHFTLGAGCGARFDLATGNPGAGIPGLFSAGYPSDLNSEGHLDITADRQALLYPSMIVASSDYSFIVKEEFE
jgi:hypothetical protein